MKRTKGDQLEEDDKEDSLSGCWFECLMELPSLSGGSVLLILRVGDCECGPQVFYPVYGDSVDNEVGQHVSSLIPPIYWKMRFLL